MTLGNSFDTKFRDLLTSSIAFGKLQPVLENLLLQGKDDYLGRCIFYPKIRLKGVEAPEPKLMWQKIKRGDQDGGEILVEAELFLVSCQQVTR